MTFWSRILAKKIDKKVGKAQVRRKNDDLQNFINKSLLIDGDVEGSSRTQKRKRANGELEKVKTKKQKMGENNGVSEGSDTVDRISELPDHIVHNIFSLLRCPKDVARTSILSKKWKSMFDSYQTFDFDERYFRICGAKGKHNRIKARVMQKRNFKNYIEKSLASRLEAMSCILKFRLCVNNLDGKYLSHMDLDRWISAAVNKNVRELEIHENEKRKPYLLPEVALLSKTITSLKLCGCALLFVFTSIELCNLRELSMKETAVSQSMIKKFEQSCPLLEDLRLVNCRILTCLHVSALAKLRRVELHECVQLNSVKIEAAYLETFWYYGKKNQTCKFNLTGCQNLRQLTLKDDKMTDEFFHSFISNFPMLEKLFLRECDTLERITILSGKLKCLSLNKCKMLKEANIDTPNLLSFEYDGCKIPFSSMHFPGLREAKFHFGSSVKASQFIMELQKISGIFDRSKGFKVILHSKQNLTIFEDPRDVRLVRYIDDKLGLTTTTARVLGTVDSWLRARHARRLTLPSSSSSEYLKHIHTMIMNREENPHCCRYYSNKCWRHYLADVKIPQTANNLDKTTYDFKWRSTPFSS